MQPRKLLLIKHSKGWDVDRVNAWAEKRGHSIERCFPPEGDQLPSPADYDAVVMFGGHMSANDCSELSWIGDEIAFISRFLNTEGRFLGICLGAQLLARALGAKVKTIDCGSKEVGFFPIFATTTSSFFPDGQPVFQWHGEGFELPKNATLLARSTLFPHQAFSLEGGHFGVQFHPEVNPQALEIWHERYRAKSEQLIDDAQLQAHMRECVESDADITAWFEDFLDQWIAGIA